MWPSRPDSRVISAGETDRKTSPRDSVKLVPLQHCRLYATGHGENGRGLWVVKIRRIAALAHGRPQSQLRLKRTAPDSGGSSPANQCQRAQTAPCPVLFTLSVQRRVQTTAVACHASRRLVTAARTADRSWAVTGGRSELPPSTKRLTQAVGSLPPPRQTGRRLRQSSKIPQPVVTGMKNLGECATRRRGVVN